MWKRIFAYLLFLAGTLWFFFLYDEPVVSCLLVFLLIYPVFSLCSLLPAWKRSKPKLQLLSDAAEMQKDIRIGISLSDASLGKPQKFRVCLSFQNIQSSRPVKKILESSDFENDRSGNMLWYSFRSDLAGTIQVQIRWIQLCDFLGLFCLTLHPHQSVRIHVYPPLDLIPLEISRSTRDFQADSDLYSTSRSSDDPSELYQIRPYRPMDPLRSIHWKLSAKQEELLVKEQGFPLGCVILVWVEPAGLRDSADAFSRQMVTLAGLSFTLLEEKCFPLVAWYDPKTKMAVHLPVYTPEDLYTLLSSLLDLTPSAADEQELVCQEDFLRRTDFACKLRLTPDGSLLRQGDTAPAAVLRL